MYNGDIARNRRELFGLVQEEGDLMITVIKCKNRKIYISFLIDV